MSCGCGCDSHEAGSVQKDYQYAVKIVAGKLDPKTDAENPLPHGSYFTKVNIHNFSRCDCTTFRWKVALGNPGLRVGPISGFFDATLCADEALEIANRDIFRALEKSGIKPGTHVEGWVVIETPAELDVVAVYGTAAKASGEINAFHTERVQPRCLTVCEDYFADISTGVAPWEFRGPGTLPTSPYTLTTLSLPHPAWGAAPAGSVWVVPNTMQNVPGDFTYRLQFRLCTGFSTPSLNLTLLADDVAKVFLNGVSVPLTGIGGMSAPSTAVATTGFQAGLNELTIVVKNAIGPTGLVLSGSIEAANGLCAGDTAPRLPCPEICYEVYTRHFAGQSGGGWWSSSSCNGDEAGTTGQHRRMEAFRAHLTGPVIPGTAIEYQGHVQGSGWTAWTPEGADCGTVGQHLRMEAIRVRFVVAPVCCSVSYQVHMKQGILTGGGGWGPWEHDGAQAGTTGQNRRIEAVKMRVDCI
jgi:Clostridial hydrophobic W